MRGDMGPHDSAPFKTLDYKAWMSILLAILCHTQTKVLVA